MRRLGVRLTEIAFGPTTTLPLSLNHPLILDSGNCPGSAGLDQATLRSSIGLFGLATRAWNKFQHCFFTVERSERIAKVRCAILRTNFAGDFLIRSPGRLKAG